MFALFIACVLISLVLLLESLGTPLRLPGQWSQSVEDPMASIPASHLYFIEISHLTFGEWKRQWESVDYKAALAAARERDLTRETHNLAERTTFKHDRANEAVAIFSLGLLFLITTLVLSSFAATYPRERLGELPRPPSQSTAEADIGRGAQRHPLRDVLGGARRASRRPRGGQRQGSKEVGHGVKRPCAAARNWTGSHAFASELLSIFTAAITIYTLVAFLPGHSSTQAWILIAVLAALGILHVTLRRMRSSAQIAKLSSAAQAEHDLLPNGILSQDAARAYRNRDLEQLIADAKHARLGYTALAVAGCLSAAIAIWGGWFAWQLTVALVISSSPPLATLFQSWFRSRRKRLRVRPEHKRPMPSRRPVARRRLRLGPRVQARRYARPTQEISDMRCDPHATRDAYAFALRNGRVDSGFQLFKPCCRVEL